MPAAIKVKEMLNYMKKLFKAICKSIALSCVEYCRLYGAC